MGISSENAAHRIAVLWNDETGREREGVFIPRRDTGSRLNHLVGARLFPGEHHFADFAVTDRDGEIFMKIHAEDGGMSVSLRGRETEKLPDDSCFVSVKEASLFFEKGSVGYSVTRNAKRLDGIRLVTEQWQVSPLAIEEVASSFFNDEAVFPKGSVEFDHALIMRDLVHRWEAVEDLATVGK